MLVLAWAGAAAAERFVPERLGGLVGGPVLLVLLGRQNLGAVVNGVQDTSLAEDPQRLAQTQAAIARIPAVATRAIRLAGVHGISAGDLLANSSVSPRTNADLLDFAVKNGDPKAAAKLATAYARAFTVYRRELDTATLQTARAAAEVGLADWRRCVQGVPS